MRILSQPSSSTWIPSIASDTHGVESAINWIYEAYETMGQGAAPKSPHSKHRLVASGKHAPQGVDQGQHGDDQRQDIEPH